MNPMTVKGVDPRVIIRRQQMNGAERREYIREYMRRWRADNPERTREHSRNWYVANRDRELARFRAYREANPDKVREYNNRKRRRARRRVTA
jgi:hypothetical protein